MGWFRLRLQCPPNPLRSPRLPLRIHFLLRLFLPQIPPLIRTRSPRYPSLQRGRQIQGRAGLVLGDMGTDTGDN